MEIYSLRSASSFFFKDDSRNTRPLDTPDFEKAVQHEPATNFEDVAKRIDFTNLSPRDLRELARESFDAGRIGHDTWLELSSGLPTQTLNAHGEVIDISDVPDDPGFDFMNYFSDRLEIARSIGPAEEAEKMENILSFFASV